MPTASQQLEHIVAWYSRTVYGRWEGPGCLPFYCDPRRVGAFAVEPNRLAKGEDGATFKLLITLSLYQSRRDVDIMRLQRAMPARDVTALTSVRRLRELITRSRCELLTDPEAFSASCTVRRDGSRERTTCAFRPRTPCHVKAATRAIGRMGDMGKISTSAFLHLQSGGWFRDRICELMRRHASPRRRALEMVGALLSIHRIGVKLATLFVSLLCTPALVPSLSPWSPDLDGSDLIVVDANVARVVDLLRRRGSGSYRARSEWLRQAARRIDLRRYRQDWPPHSARLVQQAVYWFGSQSNRAANGDACATAPSGCTQCLPGLCPFAP